jgi:hypothetical protein
MFSHAKGVWFWERNEGGQRDNETDKNKFGKNIMKTEVNGKRKEDKNV